MDNKLLTAGLVGGVFGFILALLTLPMWSGMMGNNYANIMMQPGNAGGGKQAAGSIDAHFIEQMIPHHKDAILMAGIALEKAERPEIKQLAQDIKRAQTEEIDQMRAWYKSWFGKDVPDTFAGAGHGMGSGLMHSGMMGDTGDIDLLEAALDFDQAFIEQMIPHHQMAVMLATMLAAATSRSEMKRLAQDIVVAQTREVNLMRGWYRQWYQQ